MMMRYMLIVVTVIVSQSNDYLGNAEVIVSRKLPGEKCLFPDKVQGICDPLADCRPEEGGVYRRNGTIIVCAADNKVIHVCCRKPNVIAQKMCDAWQPYWENKANGEDGCVETVPLIVGGVAAKVGEFPHMVHVGSKSPILVHKFDCGGTLITPSFVLTAAHCVIDKNDMVVELGKHGIHDYNSKRLPILNFGFPKGLAGANPFKLDYRRERVRNDRYAPTLQSIEVEEKFVHPNYLDKTPEFHSDIALLKLKQPAELTKRVLPACLSLKFAQQNEYIAEKDQETRFTVAGWGRDSFGAIPKELQKVEVLYHHPMDCARKMNEVLSASGHSREELVPEDIICAADNLKDSCTGDSGGPLMDEPHDPCRARTVSGLVSYGADCGHIGAYIRIPHYLDWITSIVAPRLMHR